MTTRPVSQIQKDTANCIINIRIKTYFGHTRILADIILIHIIITSSLTVLSITHRGQIERMFLVQYNDIYLYKYTQERTQFC